MKYFLISVCIVLGNLTALAHSLSLDDYLKKVTIQNLEYKSEEYKNNASEAAATGIRLPDPMIGLIQMKKDGSEAVNSIEISQQIPFPIKLAGNYNARKALAALERQNLFINQKKIILKAKLTYLNAWKVQESLELLKEKRKILNDHIKLTKAATRSDNIAAIHLLKAESDLDIIENEILAAEQDLLEVQNELFVIINEEPKIDNLKLETPGVSNLPNELLVMDSPQIKSLKYEFENYNSKETESLASWLPDFELKYKSTPATATEAATSETTIGVSLPFIFFWQPYSIAKEARHLKHVSENKLTSETRRLESLKITLRKKAEILKIQLDTLNNKIIPRTAKRFQMLHNLDFRDMDTLQSHREIMEALPEMKLQALNVRIKYEEVVAEIESYMTGQE